MFCVLAFHSGLLAEGVGRRGGGGGGWWWLGEAWEGWVVVVAGRVGGGAYIERLLVHNEHRWKHADE